jgi:hypothetical protein
VTEEFKLNTKQKEKSKLLAEQHWHYIVRLLEYLYVPTFEHGFKHGAENQKLVEAQKIKDLKKKGK